MQNVAASVEEQIVRIRKKLIQAKNKDKNFEVFGSKKHQYRLNDPLSLEEIELFENTNSIKIPFEYRMFLSTLGNGGAGLLFDDISDRRIILQGLVGVYIEEIDKWIRLDARGNKAGVDAQFSLTEERLAFPVRKELAQLSIFQQKIS